jgi:hypothetical protein
MSGRRILLGCGALLGTFWASALCTFLIGTRVEAKRRGDSLERMS